MKMTALILLIVTALGTAPALSCNSARKCNPCDLSDAGLSLIKKFEGYSPFPYKDSAGLWTIGYGHLIKPGEDIPSPLMGEAADNLLRSDAGFAVRGVNRDTSIGLLNTQFDALVSFTFNVGTGAYRSSTLRKRVNSGIHDDVPNQFMRWVYVTKGGKKQRVRGLARRREAEASLYSDGRVGFVF